MEQLDRSRQTIALLAAALAGFVDAVGFLSADGYFVSFMSGNTTRLAVDLAIDPHGALIPALIIIGFVAGVAGAILSVSYLENPLWLAAALTLALVAFAAHIVRQGRVSDRS